MSRSVLTTILVCAAVLAAAWWLYPRLFPEAGGPVATATRDAGHVGESGTGPDIRAQNPSSGATDAGAVGVASTATGDAGTAGAVVAKNTRSDAGPGAVTTNATENAPQDLRATVVAVEGFAQSRRGKGGAWKPLARGEKLDERDAVRTGRSGEARLAVGDGIEVRVSPRSEFSIREIKEGLSRVRLESGHVSASVDENGNRVLRVEAAGSDAVAESKGGAFGMVSDGLGQVAVATSRGEVTLKAKGQQQAVVAGEQSVVLKDQAPSAPAPVPTSLLLKVAEPVRKATNEAVTYIEGNTAPGSVVRVAGRVTQVSSTGKFRVPVTLKEGGNQISVNVTDASGRERKQNLPEIVLDREKPKIDAEVSWGQ